MNTGITQYEPLHKIITYDDYEVVIHSSQVNQLDELMEQNRFVKIKEMRIAVADIRRIIPAKEDKNMLETMISPLSDVQKNQVREIAKNWKMSNKHKDLTEGVVRNMIESIL